MQAEKAELLELDEYTMTPRDRLWWSHALVRVRERQKTKKNREKRSKVFSQLKFNSFLTNYITLSLFFFFFFSIAHVSSQRNMWSWIGGIGTGLAYYLVSGAEYKYRVSRIGASICYGYLGVLVFKVVVFFRDYHRFFWIEKTDAGKEIRYIYNEFLKIGEDEFKYFYKRKKRKWKEGDLDEPKDKRSAIERNYDEAATVTDVVI